MKPNWFLKRLKKKTKNKSSTRLTKNKKGRHKLPRSRLREMLSLQII